MLTRGLLVAIAGLALLAPAASAKDHVLTLYSPKIHSLPYVHDSKSVDLKADGVGAPAKPGFITGFKEMALVDSKDPGRSAAAARSTRSDTPSCSRRLPSGPSTASRTAPRTAARRTGSSRRW